MGRTYGEYRDLSTVRVFFGIFVLSWLWSKENLHYFSAAMSFSRKNFLIEKLMEEIKRMVSEIWIWIPESIKLYFFCVFVFFQLSRVQFKEETEWVVYWFVCLHEKVVEWAFYRRIKRRWFRKNIGLIIELSNYLEHFIIFRWKFFSKGK